MGLMILNYRKANIKPFWLRCPYMVAVANYAASAKTAGTTGPDLLNQEWM